MKQLFTAANKAVLSMLTFVTSVLFISCQQDTPSPYTDCPESSVYATIQRNPQTLHLGSATLFRQHTDSGGIKFLSIEAVSDSMRVILNIVDGMFDESHLANDSLHLKTYRFSALTGVRGGLAIAGIRNGDGFDHLSTDTSSITITQINTKRKTVSGNFYFAAKNRTISGEGGFQNACYVSLP